MDFTSYYLQERPATYGGGDESRAADGVATHHQTVVEVHLTPDEPDPAGAHVSSDPEPPPPPEQQHPEPEEPTTVQENSKDPPSLTATAEIELQQTTDKETTTTEMPEAVEEGESGGEAVEKAINPEELSKQETEEVKVEENQSTEEEEVPTVSTTATNETATDEEAKPEAVDSVAQKEQATKPSEAKEEEVKENTADALEIAAKKDGAEDSQLEKLASAVEKKTVEITETKVEEMEAPGEANRSATDKDKRTGVENSTTSEGEVKTIEPVVQVTAEVAPLPAENQAEGKTGETEAATGEEVERKEEKSETTESAAGIKEEEPTENTHKAGVEEVENVAASEEQATITADRGIKPESEDSATEQPEKEPDCKPTTTAGDKEKEKEQEAKQLADTVENQDPETTTAEDKKEPVSQQTTAQPATDKQLIEVHSKSCTNSQTSLAHTLLRSKSSLDKIEGVQMVEKMEIDHSTGQSQASLVEAVEKESQAPPVTANS